jgi:uncharacterized SAM-binding protein YcdF (DUF218 family)
VLGYSSGTAADLHPICRGRLVRAAEITTADDTVVFSGWSRDGRGEPEAALMRAAWSGAARRLAVDPDARTTAENAVNATDDIVGSNAREVVVVTSQWHARRASAAFRLALLGQRVRVRVVSAPGRGRRVTRVRELGLWPLLPFQIAVARRRALRQRRSG